MTLCAGRGGCRNSQRRHGAGRPAQNGQMNSECRPNHARSGRCRCAVAAFVAYAAAWALLVLTPPVGAADVREPAARAAAGSRADAVAPAASAGVAGVAGDWVPQADGQELLERRTGRVWLRCPLGMAWNGALCTGDASTHTRGEALALAVQRAQTDGAGWRLPQVLERRHFAQAQDRPGKPLSPGVGPAWYWSASTGLNAAPFNPYDYDNVRNGRTAETAQIPALSTGWAVQVPGGQARGDVQRRTRLRVWLIRDTGNKP